MNAVYRSALIASTGLLSFGAMAGGDVSANNADHRIPEGCPVLEVGDLSSESGQIALAAAGFEVQADKIISYPAEQGNIIEAQNTLVEEGLLSKSDVTCGAITDAIKQAARNRGSGSSVDTSNDLGENYGGESELDDQGYLDTGENYGGESELDDQGYLDTGENYGGESELDGNIYPESECDNRDAFSFKTVMDLQKLLGVYVDGNFGKNTCNAFLGYQIDKGITGPTRSDFGVLGSKSTTALEADGVRVTRKPNTAVTSVKRGNFNPKTDCPTKYDCEIVTDLSDKMTYIKENDNKYSAATGDTLERFKTQPGAPGTETDLGHSTLGPIEYGKNGDPWRLSTNTKEKNPNAAPNLYLFRRMIPDDGSWSGEGYHGSKDFGIGNGSGGCGRLQLFDADVMAKMATGTPITVRQ